MTLHIDKDNVISWFDHRYDENFAEIIRLVKRNINVHYNFTEEEIKKDKKLTAWIGLTRGSGVFNKSFYMPDFPQFPPTKRKADFYLQKKTFEVLSSIYLLEDKTMCDELIQKGLLLAGTVGEENQTMSKFFYLDNKEVPATSIARWYDYAPKFPLTDIVISDGYYFSNKKVYDRDGNQLIKALIKNHSGAPIHLVLIVGMDPDHHDLSIDWNTEQNKILGLLNTATGTNDCTVAIVTTNQTHDRCVITNYYRITSGCGFMLDNNVKRDVVVDTKSHAYKNYSETTRTLINNLNLIIKAKSQQFGTSHSNLLEIS